MLDASLQAVDRGAKLVRQLMVFSRREALQPHPVDPRALIAGVGELLQKAVGAPVAIETAIEPDIAAAMVDPTQAELAVLNLAINARDAMPQGGTLTIGARNARLAAPQGAAPAGDYVVLSVSDTGIGMPPEVLERVLEPFFTTKAVGKGTGLGLSMVHGFVTAVGRRHADREPAGGRDHGQPLAAARGGVGGARGAVRPSRRGRPRAARAAACCWWMTTPWPGWRPRRRCARWGTRSPRRATARRR